jgi:hypothetical protein
MRMFMDRILFITSQESDYLEEIIFSGLTETLGPDAVIAYPPYPKFYFPRKTYPRNIGKCRRATRLVKDGLEWISFRRRFPDMGLVVLGSLKISSVQNYISIADKIPKNVPMVFIDGGDWADIGGDARRQGFEELFKEAMARRRFDVIFKREYLTGERHDDNVYPLPMAFKSSIRFTPPPAGKKYGVTFWAVESHPVRTQALALLEEKFDCAANGTVRGQKFSRYKRRGLRYLRELSASKICLNFRGAGWDTLRYWEIPAVGSLMISGKPGIVIPAGFVHGETAVFVKDDLSDLTDIVGHYLRNDGEREEIAEAGRKHLFDHHTHLKRAEYFLDVVSRYA